MPHRTKLQKMQHIHCLFICMHWYQVGTVYFVQRGESLISVCTDGQNNRLVTADTAGYIKVWDISKYGGEALAEEQAEQVRHQYWETTGFSKDAPHISPLKTACCPDEQSKYNSIYLASYKKDAANGFSLARALCSCGWAAENSWPSFVLSSSYCCTWVTEIEDKLVPYSPLFRYRESLVCYSLAYTTFTAPIHCVKAKNVW